MASHDPNRLPFTIIWTMLFVSPVIWDIMLKALDPAFTPALFALYFGAPVAIAGLVAKTERRRGSRRRFLTMLVLSVANVAVMPFVLLAGAPLG